MNRDWTVSNWRLEAGGLRLLNDRAELTSKVKFVGDFQMQINYELKNLKWPADHCDVSVSLWGEKFSFRLLKTSYLKIERKGNVLTAICGEGGDPQPIIKIKEAMLQESTSIAIKEEWPGDPLLLIQKIEVRGQSRTDKSNKDSLLNQGKP